MIPTKGLTLSLAALLAGLAACPGNASDPGTATCKGQPRQRIDCASEVKYDGINAAGGLSVLTLGGVNAKREDVAIRRINEHVEKFVAAQARICKEYNACVCDEDYYRTEAKSLRDRLTGVQADAAKLGSAESEGEPTLPSGSIITWNRNFPSKSRVTSSFREKHALKPARNLAIARSYSASGRATGARVSAGLSIEGSIRAVTSVPVGTASGSSENGSKRKRTGDRHSRASDGQVLSVPPRNEALVDAAEAPPTPAPNALAPAATRSVCVLDNSKAPSAMFATK